MYRKQIYLSSQDVVQLQEAVANLPGITGIQAGLLEADLGSGQAEQWEGIEISYNPKWLDVSTILDALYAAGQPARVFYSFAEDLPQLQLYQTFVAVKKKADLLVGMLTKFTASTPCKEATPIC